MYWRVRAVRNGYNSVTERGPRCRSQSAIPSRVCASATASGASRRMTFIAARSLAEGIDVQRIVAEQHALFLFRHLEAERLVRIVEVPVWIIAGIHHAVPADPF